MGREQLVEVSNAALDTMPSGFQWQDGSHAQHVMAQELADLLRIPPQRSAR